MIFTSNYMSCESHADAICRRSNIDLRQAGSHHTRYPDQGVDGKNLEVHARRERIKRSFDNAFMLRPALGTQSAGQQCLR